MTLDVDGLAWKSLQGLGTEGENCVGGQERVGTLHGPAQSSLPSTPGNQEQPEPYMEALLGSSSAFLRWGPRHTHPGEWFTLVD